MKSKDRSQSKSSRRKKKIREINSYKIQFKTKIKQNTNLTSKGSKDKSKSKTKNKDKNNKYMYTQSNISAKTYIHKPTSSIINKYYKTSHNNNNAISYSNFAVSNMDNLKKNEKNILNESLKYNNEDYNTLIQTNMSQSNNSNNKLNLNDLNKSSSNKLSFRKNNDLNSKVDSAGDSLNKNIFLKKAAKSMANENKKIDNNFSYNLPNNAFKSNFDTSLKKFENKLSELNLENFNKINLGNIEQNLKNKKLLEKYINSNSRINKDENENNKNNEQNKCINNEIIDDKLNEYGNIEYRIQNNINQINEEDYNYRRINKNKILQDANQEELNDNNFMVNNEEVNPNQNGQNFKRKNIYKQNIDNSEEENNLENDTNVELYSELEEKFQNLYSKIRGNKNQVQQLEPFEPQNDGNQVTYHTLKRYQRQKSEPTLRIMPYDMENFINNNYPNLNINSNVIRDKKVENNTEPPMLIVKHPQGEKNDNKNLSKIKILEENLRNENSTKRKINVLLNEQSNPELKNILSELQMTMKRLPCNEDSKENNISISTQPANYLFPLDMYKIKYEKIQNLKSNNTMLFKGRNNIRETNQKKSMDKIISKFNDFQEIINRKAKVKHSFNIEPKDMPKDFNYYKSRKVYTNLCPVNSVENGIYNIDI
jgi:hypothetical protein